MKVTQGSISFITNILLLLVIMSSIYGQFEVNMQWDPNQESDMREYWVFRQIGMGAFNLLDTVPHREDFLNEEGCFQYTDTNNITVNTTYSYFLKAVDSSNNVSEPSDTVMTTISVSGLPDLGINELKVYPNPTASNLIVYESGMSFNKINVKIYNIVGQRMVVPMQLINSGFGLKVNVSKLSPGMYIYKVSDAHSTLVGRFVIVR